MTVKEYLGQGYRLEHRIKMHKTEIEEMRELSMSISSPGFEEHYKGSKNVEAPFERFLIKIMELEQIQADMLERLLCFKQELISVINAVPNKDERIVLYYRYLKNFTWGRIGMELGADESTVRRWHNRALAHVVLPDNSTIISKCRK